MTFLKFAFLSGILASISFGVIGTYVVSRRITYLTGAMAHCALGGIGLALYLNHQQSIEWITPMHGALGATLLSALILGWVNTYAKEREDTIIASIWSISMAIGLIFIAKTPKYIDATSYLFGNILFSTPTDLINILKLDAIVLGACILFYNPFLGICFDEEFTRLRKVKTYVYQNILLILIALTVVVLIQVVGIIMVIALLALPAATAGYFSSQMWRTMILSVFLSMSYVSVGISLSYRYDLPSGAMIALCSGIIFLLASIFKHSEKRKLSLLKK